MRNLERIQEMLISEIRYGKATLPECCIHIAGHVSEPYSSYFVHIYERMRENRGEMFGEVFGENMEECLGLLPLTEEDKRIFLSLFSDSGFEDEGMQIRSIEQSKEQLQHTISTLETENTEKCRMAVGLGAMSGLLLLVVLL